MKGPPAIFETPRYSIDNEIVKLKKGLSELKKQIDDLRCRLYSILSVEGCDVPSSEYRETKGKLDNELFNLNQDVEWAIENIANVKNNVMTKGEF